MAHRTALPVDDPAGDHDPLADRLAVALDGQVGLQWVDVTMPEDRRVELDGLRIGMVRILGGMAQHAAPVRRVVQPRLGLLAVFGLAGFVAFDHRRHLGIHLGLAALRRIGAGHRLVLAERFVVAHQRVPLMIIFGVECWEARRTGAFGAP